MRTLSFSCVLLACLGLLGNALGTPVLKAYPPILTPQNRSVTLSWSGITTPTAADFIAIYTPAEESSVQEFIGILNLTQSSTWTQGFGEITVPYLVNMRSDYGFWLWLCSNTSDCATYISPVVSSNTVVFDNPLAPTQGHLALTSDPSAVRLMWVSGDNTSTPTVQYGYTQVSLQYNATGNTTTYTKNLMCDSPANTTTFFKDPGFIHDAVMTDLQPSTQYFYKFGSDVSGWSEEFMFISPPATSPSDEIFVVAYGDMGVEAPFVLVGQDTQPPSLQTTYWVNDLVTTPGSTSPFAHLSKKYRDPVQPPPWTLLHIGDISYARGYAFLWDYFFDLIQPVATQVPYMVCIGNHEYDYDGMPWRANDGYGNDSGGECGVPYDLRFHMPGTNESTRNLWYSYNLGPVHFVFMSTEHDFLEGSAQYNWILQDLANVDRSVTPWIVFSGHRPAYTSSTRTTDEGQLIQSTYEPLWVKYKVNMCLWGHVHVYERTCGMVNYTCQPNDAAPVHVVIGMAGNDYQVPWFMPDDKKGDGHALQPPWSIFRAVNYGYSRFFANGTHFNFQFVGDQRGQVHDNFWLTPL